MSIGGTGIIIQQGTPKKNSDRNTLILYLKFILSNVYFRTDDYETNWLYTILLYPQNIFYILFTHFFACMSMCGFSVCGYSWVSVHVLRAEDNLELVGFLFLSCRFWGSSSGCQAWKEVFTYCATVLAHKIILRRLFVFIIFTTIPCLSQESSPPNTRLVRLPFPIFCPSFIFPSIKDYNFSRLVSSFKDYNFTLLLF